MAENHDADRTKAAQNHLTFAADNVVLDKVDNEDCFDVDEDQFFNEHRFGFPYATQAGVSIVTRMANQESCRSDFAAAVELFRQSEFYRIVQEKHMTTPVHRNSFDQCLDELSKLNASMVDQFGVPVGLWNPCVIAKQSPPYDVVDGEHTITGPSHVIVPVDQFADFRYMEFQLHEILLPLHDPKDLERFLQIYLDTVEQNAGAFAKEAFVTELYLVPKSAALISPTRNKPSLRFSLLVAKAHPRPMNVFKLFWDMFRNHNVEFTLHWGKVLPLDQRDLPVWCEVKNVYGEDLKRFRTIVDHFDPHGVFRDTYWQEVLWNDQLCPVTSAEE
jgi:hypothetical protein